MKKLLVTCIFIFSCGLTYAQDRIELRDGNILWGKVILISDSEVEYITGIDPGNPTVFRIPKANILFIQYADGSTDTINDNSLYINRRRYFDENSYPKYQGDFAFGYAIGFSKYTGLEFNSKTIETIHGVRINPYLFTGAGVSYSSLLLDWQGEGALDLKAWGLFANIRGCYPISRSFTAYMSLDVGGTFFGSYSQLGESSQLNYAIGPSICLGHDAKIYFDLGVRFQHIADKMNTIMIRVAIGF